MTPLTLRQRPMPGDLFRFENFELDRSAYELRRDGQGVRLERIPFELLCLLVDRSGQLVAREEIIERIWGKDVFHDTEHGINTAVRKIRQALHDDPEAPRFVLTVPAKGYRFVASVEKVEPPVSVVPREAEEHEKPSVVQAPRKKSQSRFLISAVVFLLAIAVAGFFHFHRVQALSEKDTVVIADFANSTGDPVFDDTLKQALSVELSQSPFLNILSDQKMSETLQMMGHAADERVNEKTAVKVCQRTQSAAVLAGSITTLGSEYVIGLNAVTCRTGDILAKEQLRASSKEEVLKVVDRAATKLRGKLGESLSMIQKFDIPVEQATTPSLEALQAFSLGAKAVDNGDYTASVRSFQRAIALDPNFALAYAYLSGSYGNLGERSLAIANAKEAYELREHVSEREKLVIEGEYNWAVIGDLEKARDVFELFVQTYPRDSDAHFNLGNVYDGLGQYEKGLAEAREAVRLEPASELSRDYLVYSYLTLNRFSEAQNASKEALAKNLPLLNEQLYMLAFLENDAAGMAQQVASATGKPGIEDVLLGFEANTSAYSGQLAKARELSRRAVAAAERAKVKETAASHEANAALREALFGNQLEARQLAATALKRSGGRDVLYAAALAVAMAAESAKARSLSDDLARAFREDTLVRFNFLPTLRA